MNKEFKKALLNQIAKNKIEKLYNGGDHSYVITNAAGKEILVVRDVHAYDKLVIIANCQTVWEGPSSNENRKDILNACIEKLNERPVKKTYVKMTDLQRQLMKSWKTNQRTK